MPLSTIPLPDEIRELLEDPSQWADLLLALHQRHRLHFVRLIFLEVFRESVDKEEIWAELWETDFVAQLADIILDDYFCGYSKEELISSKGREDMTMVGQMDCINILRWTHIYSRSAISSGYSKFC